MSRSDFTPYANRWVALVRGRVMGVGLTRQQAHRAAKRARPKEEPALYFVDTQGQLKKLNTEEQHPNFEAWLQQHPLLQKTVEILRGQKIEAYLVGGPVRDLLLGRQHIVDFDFAVPGDGLAVARQVANALKAAFYPLDPARGTGRVVCQAPDTASGKIYLDFATFRGPSLQADLADRDFTINAIALSLDDPPQLVDPLHGRHHLHSRQIKVAAAGAFARDPVRTLRAVRQAVQFGFSIETETGQQLTEAAPQLPNVSAERQRDELLKLLNTPAPGQAVDMLHRLGLLPHLLPEVEAMVGLSQSPPHHLDVFDHTVAALNHWVTLRRQNWPVLVDTLRRSVSEYLSKNLAGDLPRHALVPLALLLHDAGKPLTRSEELTEGQAKVRFLGHERESAKIARRVMQRLHFSSQATTFVETVVAQHMRPLLLAAEGKVSRRAVFRFFQATDGATVHAGVAVALHALADHRATYPPGQGQAQEEALLAVVHRLVSAYFEQQEQVVNPQPLLSGYDIKMLGVPQGHLIGTLLRRLKEAQAVGRVTTKAQALEFIKSDPDFARSQADEL